MNAPTREDAQELADWTPPLGVVTVLLGFEAGDRGGAWRTELRNGLDRVRDAAKEAEHERRVALRATAERIGERFEDGAHRPPPRGEIGFVEVAEKHGREHWWGLGEAPHEAECVHLGEAPLLAPLVELDGRRASVFALLSAERVRLLRFDAGALSELEDWELSVFSLDWRERKAASNQGGSHGVSSSGHDRYDDRLEHNRSRFLAECAALAGDRVTELGGRDLLLIGPAHDADEFRSGFKAPGIALTAAGTADLVSTPLGQLGDEVATAAGEFRRGRDQACVARILEEARGGSRGAAGRSEVSEALTEGRVEHLVLDAAIGEAAEALVRGALGSGAATTIVRDETAEPLASAEGAAALLRY